MTTEERIEALEKEVKTLRTIMENDWHIFQNLFGIRMIPQKNGNMSMMIVVPKKNEGKPGMLAEIYLKVDKLWNNFKESEVLIPRLDQ